MFMPSHSYGVFEKYAVKEVEGLIAIFRERNANPGPNTNYGLLHGGLILLVSSWEAYCEDVSKEAVNKMASDTTLRFDDVSETLRRRILQYALPKNPDNVDLLKTELPNLVGEGWRRLLENMIFDYLKDFNSPKFSRTTGKSLTELFKRYLSSNVATEVSRLTGIENLAKKIDKMVTVRGTIAHRGKPEPADHFSANGLLEYLTNTRAACAAIESIIQAEFSANLGIIPWRITGALTAKLPNHKPIQPKPKA
jgi:RiboL-PSP-HEPN